MFYSLKEQFNKRESQGYTKTFTYICDLQNNVILAINEY